MPFRFDAACGLLPDVVSEQRYAWGRAYRGGQLLCSRVSVTVVSDVRVAPGSSLPPRVRVRFLEGVDSAFRDELEELTRARGMRCRRLAENLEPVEIVWEEPNGWRTGGKRTRVGRLEPPTTHSAPLEDTGFQLRASQ